MYASNEIFVRLNSSASRDLYSRRVNLKVPHWIIECECLCVESNHYDRKIKPAIESIVMDTCNVYLCAVYSPFTY